MDNFESSSWKFTAQSKLKIFFSLLKNNLVLVIPILFLVLALPTAFFLNEHIKQRPKQNPSSATKVATASAHTSSKKQTSSGKTGNKGKNGSGNTVNNSGNNTNTKIKAVGNFSVLIVEFAGPNSADREVIISPGSNLKIDCTYQFTNRTTVRTVMNGPSEKDIITGVQGCHSIPAPPGTYQTYTDLTMPNLKYFSTYLSAQAALYSKNLTINPSILGPYPVSGFVSQGSSLFDFVTAEGAISQTSKNYVQNFFQHQIAIREINTSSYDFVLVLYFDDQQLQKNPDGSTKMVNGKFVEDHTDAFADFNIPSAKIAFINIGEDVTDYIGAETVDGVSFGQSWNVGYVITQTTHQLLHLFGATENGGAITNVIPIMTYPHVALNRTNAPKIVLGPLTSTEIGWR